MAAIDRGGSTWRALIISGDGRTVAQAGFPAPDRRPVTNAADPVPIPAAVADGALYFAGGDGVVRRLERSGTNTVVGAFPVAGRQLATLAVAPDGSQVAVSVLTVPLPGGDPPGHFRLDQYRGPTTGGQLPRVASADLGTSLPEPTMVVRWDSTGEVAALRLELAAQQPPVSPRFPDGPIVHLDTGGALSAPIGGPGCAIAVDELPDGTTLCAVPGGQRLQVRDAIGNLHWEATVNPPDQWTVLHSLSADGAQIAGNGTVYRAAGGPVGLPRDFAAAGWLDATTLVGTGDNGHLWLIPFGHDGLATDLGVQADFVGAV